MSDYNKNIWAPWRMEYIRSIDEESERGGGCFLCRYFQQPERDREHYVLLRTDHGLIVMNRFPYNNGHLLVAPAAHTGNPADLPEEILVELSKLTFKAAAIIRHAFDPQGLNIGTNIGRCAGAGVPDHLHSHIVPRWHGDTNFMPVLGGVRVIPDCLDATFEQLSASAVQMGLKDTEG